MSDTPPEFACTCTGLNAVQNTVCIGCRANAAIADAVKAERESIAAKLREVCDREDTITWGQLFDLSDRILDGNF